MRNRSSDINGKFAGWRSLALIVALGFSPTVSAQQADESFRLGYSEFVQENYLAALQHFASSQSPRADLFAGKSAFMIGRCSEGVAYLRSAMEALSGSGSPASADIEDAGLTLALCRIQLRQYLPAMEALGRLSRDAGTASVRLEAGELYTQMLSFLTDGQLYRIAIEADDPILLSDVNRFARTRGDTLLTRLTSDAAPPSPAAGANTPLRAAQRRQAPPGFVHVIDVALPWTSDDPGISQASKSLYQGLLLSIDQTNATLGIHVRLRLVDTNPDSASAATLIEDLIRRDPADLVIGPLFSSTAESVMGAVSAFRIPVVTPLANSDEILSAHSGIFQLNPPFTIQGIEMARHAVQVLGLDTIGVIVDRPSFGYAAAAAFRSEAERLGAFVPVFYAEDLAASGYDITPFADWLEQDPAITDSMGTLPLQGVYAPFTGQQAQTLIQLLLTEIEARRSTLTVLGTEEWDSQLTRTRLPRRVRVVHSSHLDPEDDRAGTAAMEEAFLQRFGESPDDLAWVGYDVGSYIGRLIAAEPNPEGWIDALLSSPAFKGLRLTIDLQGTRVNRHVNIVDLSLDPADGL